MSWAAHQFEVYAVQGHLPKKMRGQISFFAIFFGDFTPDFLAKFWVYGITINGHHYGAKHPYIWHRSWPGMGFAHTMFFGALVTTAYLVLEAQPRVDDRLPARVRRARDHRRQRQRRHDADVPGHDVELEPAHLEVRGDGRRGQVPRCGRLLLAASASRWTCSGCASCSPAGACSHSEYWRTQIVPADPHVWAWLGRWLDDRALLALYRSVFFYGLCRLIAWTTWAHFVARPVINGVEHHGYPWDLSWTGPWWMPSPHLPQVPVWLVLPCALALLALVYWFASNVLWDRMAPQKVPAR